MILMYHNNKQSIKTLRSYEFKLYIFWNCAYIFEADKI